jgi:capsular exopolysaccharide synthesis family protein
MGGPVVPPPALAARPNAFVLLRALQRRWLLAGFLGLLLGCGAAAAVWYFLPLNYPVVAIAQISSRAPMVLAEDKNLTATDVAAYQKYMAARIQDPDVLRNALNFPLSVPGFPPRVGDLKIVREQQDRRGPGAEMAWLEKELQVDYKAGPQLMRVTLSSKAPQEAQLLLKAVMNAFLEKVNQEDRRLRQGRLDALQAKLNDAKKHLDNLRSSYQSIVSKQTSQEAGRQQSLRDPKAEEARLKLDIARENSAQERVDRELLSTLQRDLLEVEREMRLAASTPPAAGPKSEITIDPTEIDAVLEKDNFVRQQNAKIAALEGDYESGRAFYNLPDGQTPPGLQKVKRNLDAAREALRTYQERQRPIIEKQLKASALARSSRFGQGGKTREADLGRWKSELLAKIAEVKNSLQKEIEAQQEGEISLRERKQTLDDAEAFYRLLAEARDKADIEVRTDKKAEEALERTKLFTSEPEIKYQEAETKQVLIAAGAGAGSLALVLIGIAFLEFRSRRVTTGEDVVQGLGWRLIGSLPALPGRARRGLMRNGVEDKYWRSVLTESVDATRTTLLHAARTEGVRTVMVTSAVAGEGKTSLSCHLATSLARAGRKTLLIDADLRSPAAHRLFELEENHPGLSELLRGEVELADIIRATPAANLWLIPAGQCDPQTLQALAQDALPPILDRLKEQFDFIIVDSSPVLPVVDAMVIGQHVDVVIFSLLRDVSRIPNVYTAYQRLSALGVRMLGAVVNGVHRDAYGYSPHYYAGKNSK